MRATTPRRRRAGVALATVLGTSYALAALAAAPAVAVVGGTPAAREDHPAVVPLADACTATLVAPDRLLTAGHCASHVHPGHDVVRVGTERRVVARVARHPFFQYLRGAEPAEPFRDVALVQLDAPVTTVRPVAVSRTRVRAGTRVTLVGYGTGSARRPGSFGVLRTAALVVRSDRGCRRALERAQEGQGAQYRRSVMLCTRDRDGRAPFASGCNGDSGGPLLRRTRAGRDVLVGTDSWGVACGARDGDPEVFARLAAEAWFLDRGDPGWTDRRIPEPLEPGPLPRH